MSTTTDFEKYDGLDAAEAHQFLCDIENPDLLRAYIAHEKDGKDRSTVLKEDVIEAGLAVGTGEEVETEVVVPDGVVPGETPGWPVDEAGNVLDLPTSVRDEIANGAAEIDHLRAQKGEIVNPSDAVEANAEYVKGLLDEKRGYETKGDVERAKAVDEELKRLGASGKPPSKRASTR